MCPIMKESDTVGKHIIDTKIQLSTCNRCSAYVFAAEVGGLRTMADPTPLDTLGVREALIDGRNVYRVTRVAGKPHKLQLWTPNGGSLVPDMVADHSCGMKTRNSRRVEAAPVGPPRPSATSGGQQDGYHPAPVPAGSQTAKEQRSLDSRKAAELARHRRSEYVNRVCQRCRKMIGRDRNIIGIQIGERWMWVQHDDC